MRWHDSHVVGNPAAACAGFVKFNYDGSLDTGFRPNPNTATGDGVVNAIALKNGSVYLGGRFTQLANCTLAIKNIARACGDEISEAQPALDPPRGEQAAGGRREAPRLTASGSSPRRRPGRRAG